MDVIRRAATATKWLAAGFGIAAMSLATVILVIGVALLCLVGVGLALVRPMAFGVRAVADLERRRLGALGYQISSPYEEIPTAPLAAVRHTVTDVAIRRDLAWLGCNATFGLVVTVFGLQMPLNAVREISFPAWWWLLPPAEATAVNGLVPVGSWTEAFLVAATGPVWAVLWLFLGPRLVSLHARTGRALLGPHPDVDLSARVAQLTASRAAALDAHAVELRRIERALHDGAQNRLVGVTVLAGVARQTLDRDAEQAKVVLGRVQDAAEDALAELRTVARSILPPVLENRGLDGALSALAAASPVPCRVTVDLPVRSPASVEATAYFAVSEALTNVSKHACATAASVDVRRTGDLLVAVVSDDGRGGADKATGSGLDGIIRRVQALDGKTVLSSPAGGPTTVRVELPCGS